MKKRLLLSLVTLLSGLWWSCASYYGIAFNIAIRPLVLGLLVFVLWPSLGTIKKCVLLIVSLFVANVLSAVVYGLQTKFSYITRDGETQIWIATSFGIQIVVSLLVLLAMDFTLRMMLSQRLQPDLASLGR